MQELLEIAARTGSFCVAGLFVLALAHKGMLLVAGRAHEEPLLRLSPWRRRHARLLLVLAAAAELLVAAALVGLPAVGYAAAGVAAMTYAIAARRLPAGEPCNCFGGAFETKGGAGAVRRNVALAALGALGATVYAAELLPVEPVSARTIGTALVIAAAIAGLELSRSALNRRMPTN